MPPTIFSLAIASACPAVPWSANCRRRTCGSGFSHDRAEANPRGGQMRLRTLRGVIRRRILVNFRVRPEALRSVVPPRFRLKLQNGYAVAGVCLIRLEEVRPRFVPRPFGLRSENAAHRVAVLWEDEAGRDREGVFIFRRDTGSPVNRLAGGRIFPGEHHAASFRSRDSNGRVELSMISADRSCEVK